MSRVSFITAGRSLAVRATIVLVAVLLASSVSPGAVPATAEQRVAIAMIGDSLGDGMWGGMYRVVQKDKRYTVVRGAKNSVGFTTADLTDMIDRTGQVDAFVMMIGANDRKSFFVDSKPQALLRTPKWIELYRGRVERFMDHAGKRGVPMVWILLPNMRDAAAAKDAEVVNAIVVEAARTRPHVNLVRTWEATSDTSGAYAPHFKDRKGDVRLMRAGDGVHFADPAYEVFAERVLEALKEASPRFKSLASGD